MSTISIDCLRSESGYSKEEKDSIMWTLVGDDEEFIVEVEPRTHYECTLCEKSPRSQYSLVQHVQGQYHRSEAAHKRMLTRDALAVVAKIEGEGFGKNFAVDGGAGADLGFRCRVCCYGGHPLDTRREVVAHARSAEHREELAVMRAMFPLKTASPLSLADKVRAMWKLVRDFEGEHYAKSHFERTSPCGFECTLCDVRMTSPFNTAQHARGRHHQRVLEATYAESSYCPSSSDEDYDYDYYY